MVYTLPIPTQLLRRESSHYYAVSARDVILNTEGFTLWLADSATSSTLSDGYILLRPVLLGLSVQILLQLMLRMSLFLPPRLLLLPRHRSSTSIFARPICPTSKQRTSRPSKFCKPCSRCFARRPHAPGMRSQTGQDGTASSCAFRRRMRGLGCRSRARRR